MTKLLIIEARFYADLADALAEGAVAALDAADAANGRVTYERVAYERVAVPGVLEIPAAMAYAHAGGGYDGYVLLGCVIRGETTHYDIVAVESAREAMRLASDQRLAVGNGILTVENDAQAWARARIDDKNKGGAAAEAALAMIALKARLGAA